VKANFTKRELIERLRALEEISIELIRPQESPGQLLKAIVEKAMRLFMSDGGSLYLKGENNSLFFEVALNESIPIHFERRSIPVEDRGLASYVFKTGKAVRIRDVYRIPGTLPFQFNPDFDVMCDYRTMSVLVQPLRNSRGEILGVLQLINKKPSRTAEWPKRGQKKHAFQRMPAFTKEDERLLESFAAVASASLENSQLQKDIENLFEGFVRASVHAIESRDLITRGHSDRVAALTVDLARTVSDSTALELQSFRFSEAQLAELRYASLLHDFGKIGVREATLQKEEKLTPEQKLEIRARIDEFRWTAESKSLRAYLGQLLKDGRAPTALEMARLEKQFRDFSGELDAYWQLIVELNQPTVLSEDKSKALDHLQGLCCEGRLGSKPLLQPGEILSLKIPKGSLSVEERFEIESHVTHSFEFLKKIPWTSQLARVPDIAYAHHEKMDGSGYPRKIQGEAIPAQARIMTIADIFDALTAKDRPYKKSLPLEKALDILFSEAKRGQLDLRFLNVFVEARIWETEDFIRLSNSLLKQAA